MASQSILLIQCHGKKKADMEKCTRQTLALGRACDQTSQCRVWLHTEPETLTGGNGLQADMPWGRNPLFRGFLTLSVVLCLRTKAL